MEKQFSAAGQGLMRIFFGICLSAAYVLLNTTGLLLGLMPLRVLSAITCLAVFFLVFVGLTATSVADSGYRRAIWFSRLGAVVGLLAALIMDNSMLIFALAVLRQLMELTGLVLICRLSSRLMEERDGDVDSNRGEMTWRVCVLCGVGSILCACGAMFLADNKMLLAPITVYLVLQLAGRLIFMVFLYRSQGALQRH